MKREEDEVKKPGARVVETVDLENVCIRHREYSPQGDLVSIYYEPLDKVGAALAERVVLTSKTASHNTNRIYLLQDALNDINDQRLLSIGLAGLAIVVSVVALYQATT